MKLELSPFASDGVLAGAILGQKMFASWIGATEPPATPEVCFLDFSGVNFATISCLRESVIAYRNHARSHWPQLYPVVANMAPVVLEEFTDFLRARNDAMAMCRLNQDLNCLNPSVVGIVDGKQLTALTAVLKLGEVEAPQLAAKFKDVEAISTTAWNNRLAALATKGLLIETANGRSKSYKPVLEGMTYGT